MSRIKVSPPTPSPIPDPKVSSSCLTTTSRSVWPSSLNSYKPPEIVRRQGWYSLVWLKPVVPGTNKEVPMFQWYQWYQW